MTTHTPQILRLALAIRVIGVVLGMLLIPAAAQAQRISVKSATPSTGEQGSLDLQVAIAGSGFGPGAQARFVLSGTDNPDGIRVKSTQFVSNSQLIATIDIDDAASLALFDITVALNGRSGKGTDLFQVVQNVTGAPRLCPPPPVDPRFQIVATLNRSTSAGSTVQTSLGISMAVGRSTVTLNGASREVLVVGAGTSNSNSSSGFLEVFFVDPTSGAVLDGSSVLSGSSAQPHLSYAMPTGTAAGQLAGGDVNGDGITDFAVTTHNGISDIATLFVGEQDVTGVISYRAIDVPHPLDDGTRFGYGVAMGDITGDGVDEFIIADGYACCSSGKQAGRPSLSIFSGVGGTPVLLQRVLPTNGTTTALASYGRHLAIGDVSGDGINDIVVATESWSDGKVANTGAVLVHHGSGTAPTWVSPTAIVLLEASPAKDHNFGAAVLAADFARNGDAALDVIAIAKADATAEVFRGPLLATGQTSDPLLRLPALSGWIRGWWTRPPAIGDLNGDGLTDVVFGAPHAPDDTTCHSIGAVQVFLATGSPETGTTGWEPFLLTPSGDLQATYGWSVAVAAGTRLIFVAERGRDVGGTAGPGLIYVYRVLP